NSSPIASSCASYKGGVRSRPFEPGKQKTLVHADMARAGRLGLGKPARREEADLSFLNRTSLRHQVKYASGIFPGARQLVRRFRDQAALRTGSGNARSGRASTRRQ